MREQPLKPTYLQDYAAWLTRRQMSELRDLAGGLEGKRIYEINSTATGGGVVELLRSQVPLMRGMGLDAHWLVLPPDDRFFAITKQIHNGLQGAQDGLPEDIEYYDQYSQLWGDYLPLDGDLYVLHDPQTLGLIPFLRGKKVLWRCHIDITHADPAVFAWLRTRLNGVGGTIFSMKSYAAGMPNPAIIMPSIDPLQPKNQPLMASQADALLKGLGVDPHRPFITQISRYDTFKDPIGVLNLMKHIAREMPELQCVMLGNFATDDPEGEAVYRKVKAEAESMANVHILVNMPDNELVVSALQSRAVGVIQYSSREGFGLTVTEAMWKKALVFARPVGGIVAQIKDHKSGIFLSGIPKADAAELVKALQSASLHDRLGAAAHDFVRQNFITPVMVADYLQLYSTVLSATMARV